MKETTVKIDERIRQESGLRALLRKPAAGALAGAILVFLFFGYFAGGHGMFSVDGVINWASVAAQLMIIATGACLLMIAGEFDLSVGSMIGFSGMTMAICTVYFQLPLLAALAIAIVLAGAIGFLNGWIVVKTGLPSFIVSLAFLFILRGLTIAGARGLTNQTLVSGIADANPNDPLLWLFGGKIGSVPMVIFWAALVGVLAHLVLSYTRFGNWIFASGGDPQAARNLGVPVNRVKISLFVISALCATLYAACQVFEFGTADAERGTQKEFEAIIAVVIGGALLTGGYGSVIGALLGALIFGVVQQGIFYTGWDSDWFRVFLGGMLLLAVVLNNWIRKQVTGGR